MRLSRFFLCLGIALCALLAVFLLLDSFQSSAPRPLHAHSLDSWQKAATPLGFARENKPPAPFDYHFLILPAFERATIPHANAPRFPLGAANGALSYNAQPFWTNNLSRGGHHSGDDYNGIGGMDSDLGDPVYPIANGKVVYTGIPSKGWGKTILIAHALADGTIAHSLYAHLQDIAVAVSQNIASNQIIGTLGTANGLYIAHLHLEWISSDVPQIGRGYLKHPDTRSSPTRAIHKLLSQDLPSYFANPFALISP